MSKAYNIAIVGATGAVGVEILRVLERRNFSVSSLRLLASARSAGKKLTFRSKPVEVKSLEGEDFRGIDFAFFSAGATRSREYAPIAMKAGAVVVDNSSAYRMQEDVPLVIPEVNGEDLKKHKGLIANPNCCAAILTVAIGPIHRAYGIRKLTVATYQSASGAGAQAMQELEDQVKQFAAGQPVTHKVFPHQIAFNVFSHNTAVAENGFNDEENKLILETRKILHAPDMVIAPTCIRVPVLRAHSEAISLDLERDVTVAEVKALLQKAEGVEIVDDVAANRFPMPLEASGKLDVLVGRIRQIPGDKRSLALFVSGDQLLKGAAWNAVQIAEKLISI